MNLTKSQKQVVDSKTDALVSASAGSGKTSTIIEKIVDELKTNSIKDMLVITFTDLASLEMKTRLKEKLKELNMLEEYEKVNNADISTLHAFCSKLLRKYYYLLEIKPDFSVLEEGSASYLKTSALEKTIKFYAKNMDEDFQTLSTIFGGGRDFEKLKKEVFSFNEFLKNIKDKKEYLENICYYFYDEDLSKNRAIEFLNDYILDEISLIEERLYPCLNEAKNVKAEFYENFILECIKDFENFKGDFFENVYLLNNLVLKDLRKRKESEEENLFRENFKDDYGYVRNRLNALKKQFPIENKKEIVEQFKTCKKIIKKFIEIEENYEKNYTRIKRTKNALDFNDLEKYALLLLDKKGIKEDINFKFIFVDEYQDINYVQEEIINKLKKFAVCTYVGDVKQSIYGFRNSTPDIFIERSKNDKLLLLNENFRSNPKILDFVNIVFKNLFTKDFGGVDYEKKGMLKGKASYKKVSREPEVEIFAVDTNEEEKKESFGKIYSVLDDKNDYTATLDEETKEGVIIAKKIKELKGTPIYDAKTKETREITFNDIAIISRKNSTLRNISKVLIDYKVPINSTITENAFSNREVDLLLNLLKILSSTHDDRALASIMESVFGGFSFSDLAKIRKNCENSEFFFEAVKSFGEKDYTEEENLKLKEKINDFYLFLFDLRHKLSYMSLFEVLSFVCEKFDYYDYVLSLPDGSNRLKNVYDYINSFNNKEYNYDLEGYLNFVKNYAYEGKFKSTYVSSSDSVKLMTIHASKGLEFPVVFVCGCGKSFGTPAVLKDEILVDKDSGLGVDYFNFENRKKKASLPKLAIDILGQKKEKAEELRLLYVALTRAKNHLYVVGELPKNMIKLDTDNNYMATSYMNFVLSASSVVNFKNIIANRKSSFIKLEKGRTKINVYSTRDFVYKKEDNIKLKFLDVDKNEVEKLKNIIDFSIKPQKQIALKNSVSSLLRENTEVLEAINYEPKSLEVGEEITKINRANLGTYFHNVMQKIDYTKKISNEELKNIFDELKIEKEYRNKIKLDDVNTLIEKVLELRPKEIKKEVPFISYLPYKEIFESDINDKILLQGIADLLVFSKDKNYLVDFKTNRGLSADQLVDKYRVQLKLYQICLQKALNICFDEVLIYSTYLKKFIKIF